MITFSSASFGGILIEPQLGFILSSKSNSGNLNLASDTSTATIDSDFNALGASYGAKLGYQFFGLISGISYFKNTLIMKDVTSSKTDKSNITNIGLFVGYSNPSLFQMWGAYNFSSKGNISILAVSGISTELGLGLRLIPFLSLNFIYRQYDITEITTSGFTFPASGFKPKEMELAVSAPFNLF